MHFIKTNGTSLFLFETTNFLLRNSQPRKRKFLSLIFYYGWKIFLSCHGMCHIISILYSSVRISVCMFIIIIIFRLKNIYMTKTNKTTRKFMFLHDTKNKVINIQIFLVICHVTCEEKYISELIHVVYYIKIFIWDWLMRKKWYFKFEERYV